MIVVFPKLAEENVSKLTTLTEKEEPKKSLRRTSEAPLWLLFFLSV